MREGKEALISLRPEKIHISKTRIAKYDNCLQGSVESIVYHGRSTQYNVLLQNGKIIQAFVQNEEHFETVPIDYDDTVFLHWQKESCVILEK